MSGRVEHVRRGEMEKMSKSVACPGPVRLAARKILVFSLLCGIAGGFAVIAALHGDRLFDDGKSQLVIEKKPELILIDPSKRTAATLLT